ncbi:MAG: hypothetical protein LBJ12_01645 [Oscillospiraceae bacterium]|nr:hypothetical protein [Oscillospiraceae bacterium]
MFGVRKLSKAGGLGGHHALPKQVEDGVRISLLLRKEADAYDEYCIFAWGGGVFLQWAVRCSSIIENDWHRCVIF